MRLRLPVLAVGTIALAAACAGGATLPTPETATPAASPTATVAADSPAPSPEGTGPTSPEASPASSPEGSPPSGPDLSPGDEGILISGDDYFFEGVPSTIPVGTTLEFTNAGAEAHEMVVVRKNDGVIESFDELLALPGDEAFQFITLLGAAVANPGEDAETPVVLAEEGEHLMICFIPQGTTDIGVPPGSPGASGFESSPGATLDGESPDTGSPGATATGGPPHFVLGMAQGFTVTEAGSTPGPIATPESPGLGSPGLESPATSPGESVSP